MSFINASNWSFFLYTSKAVCYRVIDWKKGFALKNEKALKFFLGLLVQEPSTDKLPLILQFARIHCVTCLSFFLWPAPQKLCSFSPSPLLDLLKMCPYHLVSVSHVIYMNSVATVVQSMGSKYEVM